LKEYKRRAELLSYEDIYKNVCKEIDDMGLDESSRMGDAIDKGDVLHRDPTYIYVGGSSGTGKTQFAFSLEKHLTRSSNMRKLFFWTATVPEENSQEIYKCFKGYALAFSSCIEQDFKDNSTKGFSIETLKQQHLYSFGFIKHVLEGATQLQPICKVNCEVVCQILREKYSLTPVFVLDEFPPSGIGKSSNHLRLMRNVFLACGLPLIIMGTNSTASNLIPTSQDSRTEDTLGKKNARKWCRVYQIPTETKMAVLDTLEIERLPVWGHLKPIVELSRPLFAIKAMEVLLDYAKTEEYRNNEYNFAGILDRVITDAALRIYHVKNIFGHIAGSVGQFCLYLNTSYVQEPALTLMHHHFSQMPEQAFDLYLADGMLKKKTSEGLVDWSPSSYFPNTGKDLLLYLYLMNFKGTNAFGVDISKRVSMKRRIELIENDPAFKSMRFSYQNSAQASNDGNFSESLLSASICAASHFSGISGAKLQPFLKELLFHMYKEQYSFNVDCLAIDLTISFLSPPNQKWPECIYASGNFDNCSRTVNSTRIDFIFGSVNSAGYGSAESKDMKIVQAVMNNIVERIPFDSRLHIVYVKSLQKNYHIDFKSLERKVVTKVRSSIVDKLIKKEKEDPKKKNAIKKKYATEIKAKLDKDVRVKNVRALRRCCFYRTHLEDNEIRLQKSIAGIPNAKVEECSVIFICQSHE
jgi:hypothetical protein